MIRFNYPDEESSEKWMPCPKDVVEYPGLAYIYNLDHLIVARKLDRLHDLTGKCDVGYTIYNNLGEKVFIAAQENRARQFQIRLFNLYGNEVVLFKKHCNCFINSLFVWAPPDNFVGSVRKLCLFDKYELKNSEGTVVLIIVKDTGKVYSVSVKGVKVGMVMQGWKEVPHENFGVSFPEELSAGMKTVVLGACFLIGCLKY